MPRPSLKAERREQILDAYAYCVAHYGVNGATLERVAEEAGLARALIRHNVGNRDDLLTALIERFKRQTDAEMEEILAELPARNRTRTLVRWMFDPQFIDKYDVLVSDSLIVAAARDDKLAKTMRTWLRGFQRQMEAVLREDFPNADAARISAVAAGVMGLYFNVESSALLGKMSDLRDASRAAAFLLLETLE